MALNTNLVIDAGHRMEQMSFPEIVAVELGRPSVVDLFMRRGSDRPSETEIGLTDVQLAQPVQGGQVAEAAMRDLYPQIYSHIEYELRHEERDLAWSNRGMLVQDTLRGEMAQSLVDTVKNQCALMLVRAFNGAYLFGDGKSLAATDHPQTPGSLTTWSNKGTTALSSAAYDVAWAAMANQLSPSGNVRTQAEPAYLVVGNANRGLAMRLTGTQILGVNQTAAGVVDLAMNPVVSDGIQPIVTGELDKASIGNSWFLARPRSLSGLQMFLRRAPFMTEGDEGRLGTHWIRSNIVFSVGANSGRQIFGNEV